MSKLFQLLETEHGLVTTEDEREQIRRAAIADGGALTATARQRLKDMITVTLGDYAELEPQEQAEARARLFALVNAIADGCADDALPPLFPPRNDD